MFVFLCGVNPLRIYVYNDGIATQAESLYKKATDRNLNDLEMHVTDEEGEQILMSQILDQISEN